eukprot:14715-Heterococcus_DN1.PRE.6
MWLIPARLLIGFASGYASVIVPIYLGELAPPTLRGTLGTLTQCCYKWTGDAERTCSHCSVFKHRVIPTAISITTAAISSMTVIITNFHPTAARTQQLSQKQQHAFTLTTYHLCLCARYNTRQHNNSSVCCTGSVPTAGISLHCRVTAVAAQQRRAQR